MGIRRRVEGIAPEADSVQQDSAFRLWGSDPPSPPGPTERRLPGGTAASCGGLGTAKGITRKLCHCWSGRCPTLSFPGQHFGTRHPGLAPSSPPGHSLISRRPAWSQGPPAPREMFPPAFPGDYDSGSRCSLTSPPSLSIFRPRWTPRQSTHRRRLPGKF